MLQQPVSGIVPAGTIDTTARPQADHLMDVFQYGMALLAIVGAALLATFR